MVPGPWPGPGPGAGPGPGPGAGAGPGPGQRPAPARAGAPGPPKHHFYGIFLPFFWSQILLGPPFDHFLTTFSPLFGVIIWEGQKPPFDQFFTTWFCPCKNQFFTNFGNLAFLASVEGGSLINLGDPFGLKGYGGSRNISAPFYFAEWGMEGSEEISSRFRTRPIANMTSNKHLEPPPQGQSIVSLLPLAGESVGLGIGPGPGGRGWAGGRAGLQFLLPWPVGNQNYKAAALYRLK